MNKLTAECPLICLETLRKCCRRGMERGVIARSPGRWNPIFSIVEGWEAVLDQVDKPHRPTPTRRPIVARAFRPVPHRIPVPHPLLTCWARPVNSSASPLKA